MQNLRLFDSESLQPTWKNRVEQLEVSQSLPAKRELSKIGIRLVDWYNQVRRPLPWRETRDPYLIWISEVMLQQTTVKAVIPHFQRFTSRFPSLASLATARVDEVLEQWAGLGYYSRARNLHLAARELFHFVSEHGFWPQKNSELIEFSGFGPYTANAVASLAFDQRVGVLDGNVNRVLCRLFAMGQPWWTTEARGFLQKLVDTIVIATDRPSADTNQALMELGATVCSPKNPSCFVCPVRSLCRGLKTGSLNHFPLPRERRPKEIWIWRPLVVIEKNSGRAEARFLLSSNDQNPFLKGHLVPPGAARKARSKPSEFLVRGVVTHHEIFVVPKIKRLTQSGSKRSQNKGASSFSDGQWVGLSELKRRVPSSLVRSILERALSSL